MDADASCGDGLAIVSNMSRREAHAWALARLDDVTRRGAHWEAIMRCVQNYRQVHPPELRAIVNSTAPVHCIPDELLVEIFLCLKRSSGCNLKEWLKVSVVCKRWRQVALHAPVLWSSIYCNDEYMGGELNTVPMCLQRSRQAPLYVYAQQYYTDRALSALRGHEERIAHLNISYLSLYYMQARFHDALSKMVNIESLHLEGRAAFYTVREDAVLDPDISLLAVHAGSLKKITLMNLCLRTPTAFSSLTHLDMRSYNPDFNAWLSVLTSCPRLESLHLHQLINPLEQPPVGPSPAALERMTGAGPRRVELPALRALKLELFLHHIAFFLERLVVTHATHISLDAVRQRVGPPVTPALLALRRTPVHDVRASAVKAIRVVFGEYFHVSAWPTPDGSHKPLVRLTVPARQTAESLREVLSEVLTTFVPSPLAFAYLDTTWLHGVDEKLCLRLLRQYPELTELRVAGVHSHTTLPALYALREHAVCPKLAVLKLYSTNYPRTVGVVLGVLRRRKEMGLHLKELHFLDVDYEDSTADEAVVELLKSLVDVFQVVYDRGSLHG